MADETIKTEATDATDDPKKIVENTIEQRKASARYFEENYYSEFSEIYRNLNARTVPYKTWNRKSGEWQDDKTSRTNVCAPDQFVMHRRGTARLTRNPPNLRVRGGPDSPEGQANRDKVSAKLMYQWDRSESQRAFKKIVSGAYALGWAVGKSYYDEVPVVRRLRRLTTSLQPKGCDNLPDSKDPQIASIVKQFGERLKDPAPFTADEQATMTASLGNEVSLNVNTMKYKGPVLDHVFIGD